MTARLAYSGVARLAFSRLVVRALRVRITSGKARTTMTPNASKTPASVPSASPVSGSRGPGVGVAGGGGGDPEGNVGVRVAVGVEVVVGVKVGVKPRGRSASDPAGTASAATISTSATTRTIDTRLTLFTSPPQPSGTNTYRYVALGPQSDYSTHAERHPLATATFDVVCVRMGDADAINRVGERVRSDHSIAAIPGGTFLRPPRSVTGPSSTLLRSLTSRGMAAGTCRRAAGYGNFSSPKYTLPGACRQADFGAGRDIPDSIASYYVEPYPSLYSNAA